MNDTWCGICSATQVIEKMSRRQEVTIHYSDHVMYTTYALQMFGTLPFIDIVLYCVIGLVVYTL
jgi:hypothetical protein